MTNVIRNKQIELQADALNTASTSCFTVGIATPIAGYLYNVGGLQLSLSPSALVLGGLGWLVAATGLHLLARQVLRRLLP